MKKDKGDKGFTITYQQITPESAENGEFSDQGWIDEEGVSMLPDKFDLDEGMTAVDCAIEYLENNTGANGLEYSDSHGVRFFGWWTALKVDEDYSTGMTEDRGYHPYGFAMSELTKIADHFREV